MGKYQNSYLFVQESHSRKKGFSRFLIVLLVLAGLVTGIWLYNKAVNQVIQLEQDKVSVMALDKNFEGFRVLTISDLSADAVGSNAERWNRLLSGQKWNAVVLCGDMVGSSGNSEPMMSLIHELLYLNSSAPVFFVAGDGDPEPVATTAHGSTQVLADWILDAEAVGAVYLDAPASVSFGKYQVWFSPSYLYDMDVSNSAESLRNQLQKMENQGQQYEGDGGAGYRAMQYRLDAMERTLQAIEKMTENDLQIAVNHMPLDTESIRTAVAYADTSSVFNFKAVDLVLCGHLCGGQYRLPGIGPIYVSGKGLFPGDTGVRGMNRVNSINLYIAPGISSSSTAPVKFRLFNRPAVSILRFTSEIE